MTDKQIIDEERTFECVWCKYDFKESNAHFILSANPNECVCRDCMTEWADNLLCDFKRKEQECEELKEIIKHIDHNRMQKANKLKRIEEIIIACKSGYTDEFIQSILAIVLEAEPIKE